MGERVGHRVKVDWLGETVETLEDLLKPGLHAVLVGINPSPVSVRAGHYYQGRLGQALFERLRSAGVVPRGAGWEDDLAFNAGLGFTDIVKRPTKGESELRTADFEHGRGVLEAKLERFAPPLVIFSFKKTAVKLFGPFDGNGFVPELQSEGRAVFVMPGPYEKAESVAKRLEELSAVAAETGRGAP